MKVGLASDHAGYGLKQSVIEWLKEMGHEVKDFGCYNTDSCDYPDFAHSMANAVEQGLVERGIAICSTGNGISMTVNKHAGIRAALCWDVALADFARRHNDANILSLPANYISKEMAKRIVEQFFTSEFEGGRHQRRIEKIPLK